MYLPVSYSPATPATGLGFFKPMDAELQESEFYPPPYNTDSPIDLSDIYGMGLFDSADWTTWGMPEWITLAAGLYFGVSLVGDIGRGAQSVRKTVRRRSAAKRRKQELAAL